MTGRCGLRALRTLGLSPSLGNDWPAIPATLRVQAWPWFMALLWPEQRPPELKAPWAAVPGLGPLQLCPHLSAWVQGKQGLFVLEADLVTSEQTWLASTPLPDLDVRAAVHVSFSRKQKAVPVEKTSQLACPAGLELSGYMEGNQARLWAE